VGAEATARHLEDGRRTAFHPGRPAGVAVVEADDVKAAIGEAPAEVLVPPDHLDAEAHDQENRWVGRRAEGLVAEPDSPAHVCEFLVHRSAG
jgi:hypothetical protein